VGQCAYKYRLFGKGGEERKKERASSRHLLRWEKAKHPS
jgi:hypothetical protein